MVFDNKFRRAALNRLHFSVADDHLIRVCWIRDQVFILVFSTPVRSRSRLRTTLNHWLLASLRTHLPILHCPYLPLVIKCLLRNITLHVQVFGQLVIGRGRFNCPTLLLFLLLRLLMLRFSALFHPKYFWRTEFLWFPRRPLGIDINIVVSHGTYLG